MFKNFPQAQADLHIQPLDDGTKLFYPQIPWGRGYYISSPELEHTLRQILRHLYRRLGFIWLFSVGFCSNFSALVSHNPLTFTLAVLLSGVMTGLMTWLLIHLSFSRYTRQMEIADIPYSPIARESQWVLFPRWLLILGVLLCMSFIAGGIWLYTMTTDPTMLVCSSFFSLLLIPYAIGLYKKVFTKNA